ncbi:protein apterous-like isoform X2 [Arctopsyche grandis]|uniref:protein apterous-like isoform X2 n=1 Tax=Arctopsyche grandis TaxID=121162 RepID=UPI00406D7BE6
MGVYQEASPAGTVMHWQCERGVAENNNVGGRGCGGCESRCAGCAGACGCCAPRPAEPPPPPQCSPGAVRQERGQEQCAGCGRRIKDRYFLQAVERRWHEPCLRCCECHLALDSELTCFAKDGNIFCKKDYYKLFGTKRCARCQASISSSELVMRARDLVFHVHCFCCALCNMPLTKGDTFGMRDSSVYCRMHYEALGECGAAARPPELLPPPFFNGATGGSAPRQKGRPRKRKPKDLEAMTANLDLNTEYMDMGFSRSGSGLGGSSRTKRMRTSFKHHQLRTMKSYFAMNHNPDAKDLKQLSQKTGLPKRVLQVNPIISFFHRYFQIFLHIYVIITLHCITQDRCLFETLK